MRDMENFKLRILGSGSALPTKMSNQPSQIVETHDKLFMIDCGEGTQCQMRRLNVRISRLNHLFVSHLHGDHCFGVVGLISTLDLLGRTSDFHVYAHKDLERLVRPQLDYFCQGLAFNVIFHHIDPKVSEVIYEDNSIEVMTIPLKHKVPTCGFLFKEKPKQRHIRRDMTDFYKVPIREMQHIKNGADFVTEDGEVVPNDRLTKPADPSVSFAYCSDTAYSEKILPYIEGVDCLFHEATFLDVQKGRARETMHSTALQAAEIAAKAKVKRLVIGHFSARYEDHKAFLSEARSVFENTELAEDGRVFRF